jgi:hypothetical protein
MPENSDLRAPLRDDAVEQLIQRKTRRSFLVGGIAALAGLTGWTWLRTREKDGGVPWPFRRMLEFNERLAQGYYLEARLAPTFPREHAAEPRINGRIGMPVGLDPTPWKLRVEGGGPPRTHTLDDLKALPRVEMVTELHCIEGWSQIVYWAGARLADFIAQCPLAAPAGKLPDPQRFREDLYPYVALATADRGYYVGLDLASALHPQTLLCYEMNGQPLTGAHGAPLRLVTCVKYGIKSIKWLSTIRFTDQRPADYWAERGYDWYAGH